MNTVESENDRHTEQLAAKVSRLKHVRRYELNKFSFVIKKMWILFWQIALDIDNETKEHNRFLETMVSINSSILRRFFNFVILEFRYEYGSKFSRR